MDYQLAASTRSLIGKKVKQLRLNGQIPAVLYGNGVKNQNLSLDEKIFAKLFREAGTSSLITLSIDKDAPVKVLMRQPQVHPTNMGAVHVDLYQVNMKEKITTEIPLEFVGDSVTVTELDGKLVTNMDSIEIECLPDDLVQHIEVDVSKLTEFDQAIHVSDLKIPAGIEVLTDPELVIVVAQAPLSEEELEAELAEDTTTEAEAVAEIEVEEKGKVDEEGAEPVAEAEKSAKPE